MNDIFNMLTNLLISYLILYNSVTSHFTYFNVKISNVHGGGGDNIRKT